MATAKKTPVNVINDETFAHTLKSISAHAENMAQDVHIAGLYCINQANMFNNAGYAQQLIEAIGKKQDVRRVGAWLMAFGKLGVKKGMLVFRKRKDITPATAEGWLKRAAETPYWEFSKQPDLTVTFDYLAMVQSIVNKAAKKHELEEAGKTVTEKNVDVIKRLNDILIAFAPKEEAPAVKAKAADIANRVKTEHNQPAHVAAH